MKQHLDRISYIAEFIAPDLKPGTDANTLASYFYWRYVDERPDGALHFEIPSRLTVSGNPIPYIF